MATRKKASQGSKLSPVIQNIIIRPVHRAVQDIESWRNALKAAEGINPRRRQLYDLYFEIDLDGHLTAVMDRRINAILNTPLLFTKDGEEVEEIRDLIKKTCFETILTEIMNSKFWGHSLLWTDFGNNDIELIPRKHVNPVNGHIIKNQTDMLGDPYRLPEYEPYLLEVGNPKNFGLLLKAAQYVIYKRGDFGDWAQFAEIFGMPFRHGKYDTHDSESRKALEAALEKAGSAAYVVTPKETDLTFEWGNTSGSGMLYEKLKNACDEALSVLILGQTMTTKDTSGSGYAQGIIHQGVEFGIYAADRRFVLRVLTEKLTPILAAHGFPVEGGGWTFHSSDGLSKKDRLEIDTRLAMFIPIDDDYFYETYGVPKPADYDVQKKAKAEEEKAEAEEEEKKVKEKEGKKEKELKDEDRGLLVKLLDFFGYAPAREPGLITLASKSLKNTSKKLDEEARRLAKLIYEGKLAQDFLIDEKMVKLVGEYLSQAMSRGYGRARTKSIRTKYALTDKETLEHIEKNVYRFSAAKNYQQLQEINGLILNSEGGRRSFSQFMEAVNLLNVEYNKNYLFTEYNTAFSSSQTARQWNDMSENFDSMPFLQYSAVMDDKTRDDHAALDGVVKRFSDPFWDKYYPPNDWNCRCRPIQLPYSQAKETDLSKIGVPDVPDAFNFNSGKTRQAFSDDSPYFKKTPDKVSDLGKDFIKKK